MAKAGLGWLIGSLAPAAAFAVGMAGGPARADDPVLRITEAAEYSSGKYGAAVSTDVAVATTAVKISWGDWFLRGAVPYLTVNGPADVAIDDQGEVVATGDPKKKHRETGWGDTTLSLGHSFSRIGGGPAYFDVTGRVRLPTGSREEGLGVGAVDYGVVGELGFDVKRGGAYVSAGPRFLGDVPGLDRRDGWQADVGGWLNVGDKTTLGGGYSWRNSSVRGFDDPSELFAYVSRAIVGGWRAELNGSAGLSQGSADYSVGATLLWRPQTRHRR